MSKNFTSFVIKLKRNGNGVAWHAVTGFVYRYHAKLQIDLTRLVGDHADAIDRHADVLPVARFLAALDSVGSDLAAAAGSFQSISTQPTP